MELNDWIDEVGSIDGAAEILKERPRTVYSWYRMDRVPTLAAALNIVVKTRNVVDYNGIYGPIAKARITPKGEPK